MLYNLGTVNRIPPMTYTADGYEGFAFGNPEDLRKGPLGEVCDYQIVAAPAEMQSEIGCWLTLPTQLMTQMQ